MNQQIAVEMVNITKTFGSTVANNNTCLSIHKGEILSLLGENGSGKTTVMNMLSGIYYPDSGDIYVNGEHVTIASPKDSFDLGIGMVHQHFKLVDVFTATENVALGLKDKLDKKTVAAKIRKICDKYGFDVDPDKKIYNMSVSEKQTLEIVKVLYRGANILILDEPTAVLTPQEVEKLFTVLRKMRDDGKSIVIITHKLNEVLELSDRVTVLRKGETVGTVDTKDATASSLTEMMVGKKVELEINREDPVNTEERLKVEHLTVLNKYGMKALDDVSFTTYSGEILGIAGISGSGQKELLESIAGLQHLEEGSEIIYIDPETKIPESLLKQSQIEIKEKGIALAFVPEDRLGMGLVGDMGMTDNMMLRSYKKGKSFFTDRTDPHSLAERVKKELEVVTPDTETPVRKLSGGNVQKVLVGREIAQNPTVMMAAYAVRGLDINTSYIIYNLLSAQKKQGAAVIYVGEDLDVLIQLCDRILVLCDGKMNGIVDARTSSKEEIGMLMTHLQKEKEEN